MKNLFLFLLLIVAGNLFAYDFCVDGVYYNITSDTDLTVEVTNEDGKNHFPIVGDIPSFYTGNITIPESVEYMGCTYKVTAIGDNTFSGCQFDSLFIPHSVTSIGDGAFQFSGHYVFVPNSITHFGKAAFQNGPSVTLEDGLMTLGDDDCQLFVANNMTELHIPGSVEYIPGNCFAECRNLEKVTIGNGVQRIGSSVFGGCEALTELYFPASVKYIGEQIYWRCMSLENINIDKDNPYFCFKDGALYDKDITRLYAIAPASVQNKFVLPSTVRHIEPYALNTCKQNGPKELILPQGMRIIDDHAFITTYPNRLESIVIPETVEIIGSYIMGMNFTVLTDITNFSPNPQFLRENAFCDGYGTGLGNGSPLPLGNVTLHVLPGCKSAYETADVWKEFKIVEDAVLPVEATDIAAYDNVIYFDEVKVRKGKQKTLELQLRNKADITAMQFDLELPDGVTLDKNGRGSYNITFNTDADRTDASCHSLSSAIQPDGTIRVLCYSTNLETFLGNEGSVLDFPLTLSEGILAGDYAVKLKNVVLTATDKTAYKADEIVCKLVVPSYILGDANGDETVDVTDIVYTASHILGNSDADFVTDAADMNEDGAIDVTDIVYISSTILNGNAANAKSHVKRRASNANGVDVSEYDNVIYFEDAQVQQGEQLVMPLMLSNSAEITAMQFDLVLPDGVTLNLNRRGTAYNITFNSEADRTDATYHTLSSALQDDGSIRVLCYSTNLETFLGTEGAVLDFPLTFSDVMSNGKYSIRLRNVVLTDIDKVAYKIDEVVCNVQVGRMKTLNILDTASLFVNLEDEQFDELTYTRSFGTTNYQCLYVPMKINVADIDEDFEIYKIGAVFLFDSDGDGVIFGTNDESVVRVYKINSGVLVPNHPYYIKAKTTGTKTIPSYDNVLYASEETEIECSTIETRSTFYGNYTKHTIGEEFFTISGGGMKKMLSSVSLGAFRWYMLVTDKEGQVLETSSEAKLCIVSDDDPEATDIDSVFEEYENSIRSVYTLSGVKQNGPVKGINIVRYSDGKIRKIYVK